MASAAKINFNDEEINRMQKFFNLEVKNKSQLEETFKQLKNINGVSRVKRL
jgi:(p)ppGpp synthase/HD superfamily hydrolase